MAKFNVTAVQTPEVSPTRAIAESIADGAEAVFNAMKDGAAEINLPEWAQAVRDDAEVISPALATVRGKDVLAVLRATLYRKATKATKVLRSRADGKVVTFWLEADTAQ